MAGFSALDFSGWDTSALKATPEYAAGNALGWLYRGDKHASTQHLLSGRLYLAKSGWLLLSVPNALVRGVYDALAVPGAELPLAGTLNVPNVDAELLNAHISVMTADEVAAIGADKISERGRSFQYSLGQLCEIDAKNIAGVSKLWAIKVTSPDLAALRKTYGLTPLPRGDHAFHITVALRRKGVLQSNSVSKGGESDKATSFSNPVSRGELKAASSTPERKRKDVLPGGAADNVPDRDFSTAALAEGVEHEHEHTDNDQIAKEIAKDHLQEDPNYYVKQKEKEAVAAKPVSQGVLALLRAAKMHSDSHRYLHKGHILRQLMAASPKDWEVDDTLPKYKGVTHTPTGFQFHTPPETIDPAVKPAVKTAYSPYTPYKSVYLQEALNQFNRRAPLTYDHNKPVFQNIRDQLLEIKRRGDFVLRTQRNYEIYKSQVDPAYRHQLGLQAIRGESPMPSWNDRMIERYGDDVLASLGGAKK